jgi:hypothetical protein
LSPSKTNLSKATTSRRDFLRLAASAMCVTALASKSLLGLAEAVAPQQPESRSADHVLRIGSSPVEIAPKHIVSTITYNGQFPGPLLRFKEGQQVTVEVHNDTDTPEQLHWHGQMVSTDVDGAAEEGTPFIPARGMRRIVFTRAHPVSVSITRIVGRVPTFTRDSTAARSGRCKSNPSVRRAATTGRFFSFSKNSNRLSVKVVTWHRIFCPLPRE